VAPGRSHIVEASLDLAWSHWTGLGVRGTATPPETAVDPEALLCFSAALFEHDPRLRDEVIDWCRQFRDRLSRPRLTRLRGAFEPSITAKLESFEKLLIEDSRASGKSRLDHLDLPARALLRLRCAFGASARAELLLALLTQWPDSAGPTAHELSEVGYSKRNVALMLDDLVLAGLVATSIDANRVRYRLVDAAALRRLLGRLPETSGRWHRRLPIIASFVELAGRIAHKSPEIQAIEARRVLQSHMHSITTLGLREPEVELAQDYWRSLQSWLVGVLMTEPRTRRLRRMIEGEWIVPDRDVDRPQRPSSAVLPALSAEPERDASFVCLDLVQAPTVTPPNDWTWIVLSDAATSVYSHTIAMTAGQPRLFATWDHGDLRVYEAKLVPSLPPGKIRLLYGDEAAARAREDLPAVQIRLTLAETPDRRRVKRRSRG
jgi:hypothetical protein